jgi:microcystin degradation protein MlrC
MRIFIATFGTETNSFSPVPTGMHAFRSFEFYETGGSLAAPTWGNIPLREWRQLAEADGHEIVEGICAFAMPGGPIPEPVYSDLRDRILLRVADCKPDLVLLNLHGAAIATQTFDCEAELVWQIREIVGPDVPILAELDLHANLSLKLVAAATMLVAYKEYPHTDIAERAQDVYRFAMQVMRGDIRPTAGLATCGTIGVMRPTQEPLAGIMRRMTGLEANGTLLSVSLLHGFQLGDTPDAGCKVLTYADDDADVAQIMAETLADLVWQERERLLTSGLGIDAALDLALSLPGVVVMGDGADNPGSGATADNMTIARRLIERNVEGAVIGGIWDPLAATLAADAGVGVMLPLRIGGKCGLASGMPLDGMAQVMAVRQSLRQPGLAGEDYDMGTCAWVHMDGIDIVLVSARQQTLSPGLFSELGLALQDYRLVVVKSMQHFVAGFQSVASHILHVDGEGAAMRDLGRIPFSRIPPLWPIESEEDRCISLSRS